MKLIQILALATAMATMATAQNSSASGQATSTAKPSPTPAAVSSTAKAPAKAVPANAAAKKSAATPSGKSSTASTTKAAAQGGSAPVAAGKPEVKVASLPAKGQNAATTKTGVVTVKATPTPAVPAKTTAPAKTTLAKPGAKATAKAPAVIAVKPAQGTAAKKAGTTKAQKAPAKTPAPAPKVTQVGASGAAKAAEKPKPVTRAFGAHGRRDPFVSPIRTGAMNLPAPNCTSGKRCLSIPELVLQGTVKDMTGKMMAVVANSTKKTYFLRENDQVFNGSVEKITSDSIIFREYVKDALGRETAHEVVKKLTPAS